jgi:hypothetical protein
MITRISNARTAVNQELNRVRSLVRVGSAQDTRNLVGVNDGRELRVRAVARLQLHRDVGQRWEVTHKPERENSSVKIRIRHESEHTPLLERCDKRRVVYSFWRRVVRELYIHR